MNKHFMTHTQTILFLLMMLITAGADDVRAQNTQNEKKVLTLQDAILRGLEHNHGIRVARNLAEVDAVNRSLGNAGFLPSVQLSGTRQETDDIVREITGGELAREEVRGVNLSMDAALNWTFFDGLKMFTTYSKLTELRDLGEVEARAMIEQTVVGIIAAYYEIVRQSKLLEVLNNSVEMSGERVRIARTKQELGSGSEYEILLARADLNEDRAAVIRQQVEVNNARLRLAHLLNIDNEYNVAAQIELDSGLSFEELHRNFMDANSELEAARLRASVSRLEVKEIRSERFPELDLNLGFGAFRDETLSGIPIIGEQARFRFGITARINLFDGFNTNRRAQIARINRRNSDILVDEAYKQLEISLQAEYANYMHTHELVNLEEENLFLAERALDIALERFRLATITSVEFRETQRILLDTENRLITARFEARVSEAELLRISGMLGEKLNL